MKNQKRKKQNEPNIGFDFNSGLCVEPIPSSALNLPLRTSHTTQKAKTPLYRSQRQSPPPALDQSSALPASARQLHHPQDSHLKQNPLHSNSPSKTLSPIPYSGGPLLN